MKEKTFLIKKDGTVITLYEDHLLELCPGTARMSRASEVEWNDDKQEWEIRITDKNGKVVTFGGFTERRKAIDFEISFFNDLLAMFPGQVEAEI
jgi:hypothetical protein